MSTVVEKEHNPTTNVVERAADRRDVERAIKSMRLAIDRAPRNAYTAEVQVQAMKYHEILKDFATASLVLRLGLKAGFASEISKAWKLMPQLIAAGLDPNKL